MDDRTIVVPISEDEQAFIDEQVAAGRYATGSEVLRAALAAFEYADTGRYLFEDIAVNGADEPVSLTQFFSDDGQQLRRALEASEASGRSARAIPDIMKAVKSKLRADGSL
jgi:putative addiction module CopG family antidote